jgi:hypothetical protein
MDPATGTSVSGAGLDLEGRTLLRRAVEAVVWGVPAVNYRMLLEAGQRVGMTGSNQIVHWTRPLDWRNQSLTPNPDVLYLMPFFDLTDGPMVLEIPPAEGGVIVGSIMNCWQAAIEDVGPAGVDGGKGGAYVLLPPGHSADGLPSEAIPLVCDTRQGFALLRVVLSSGSPEDIARAVDYARRVRLHPLHAADPSAATVFVDASDALFEATIPYDLRFFEALDAMVQREPWLERDRVMIDQLRTLGIERGRTFAPSRDTVHILEAAAAEARDLLDERYVSLFAEPFAPGRQWAIPASRELRESIASGFETPDAYPVDARGLTYTYAFFSARHLGKGQFYLMTLTDADGRPLDGSSTYRLTIPPNAPVRHYWSATVYDRRTHTFIRDVPRTGRSSQSPELVVAPDGSTEIYFAPRPPAGHEANWVPVEAGAGFEVLFRFFGPTPALQDGSWVLPDLVRLTEGSA